jgi:4'-phosphopantetheinyl transferase
MVSTAQHQLPQTPTDLITVTRPVPGCRLAFVSIPCFLERCLDKAVPENFRIAPPLVFASRDFRRTFLGVDEIDHINRFKALKKQVEWMAGRYAAKHLARQFLEGRPHPAATRVAYRPQGAPYLAQAPTVPLSISHSWDYAVAGLGFDPSCRLGLDLERIRPGSRATLLRTAFSDREAAALTSGGDAALFLRWTAKEAYLKAVGKGFHESLKQVEILDDTIWHHHRPVPSLTLHSRLPFQGYAFSLVRRTL